MKIVCIDCVYASVNKLLKWAASISAGPLKAKRNKNDGRCQVSHVPKAGTRLPLQDRWGGRKTNFAITNTPPLSEGTRPGGGFLGEGRGCVLWAPTRSPMEGWKGASHLLKLQATNCSEPDVWLLQRSDPNRLHLPPGATLGADHSAGHT